jgi:hypothetical protein
MGDGTGNTGGISDTMLLPRPFYSRLYPVYARVVAAGTLPAGSYADVVTVQIGRATIARICDVAEKSVFCSREPMKAVGLGSVLTAIITGAACLAALQGAATLANILFWPNTLLQRVVPCVEFAPAPHGMREETPLNALMYWLSFPISAAIYTGLAYLFIRRKSVRPK